MSKGYFATVYKIVKKIPEGKVATYGQVAEAAWKSQAQNLKSQIKITPRVVGWALHANKNPKVPCHRVVDRNGKLAPNFAFGGYKEQRVRLLAEKVSFVDEKHVDLEKYLWLT